MPQLTSSPSSVSAAAPEVSEGTESKELVKALRRDKGEIERLRKELENVQVRSLIKLFGFHTSSQYCHNFYCSVLVARLLSQRQ